jgi:hypothetical protein
MNAIESGLAGITQAQTLLEQTAEHVAHTPLNAEDARTDSVDLSAAAVALMTARNTMQVSVKVIQTADEMTRSTFDLLG